MGGEVEGWENVLVPEEEPLSPSSAALPTSANADTEWPVTRPRRQPALPCSDLWQGEAQRCVAAVPSSPRIRPMGDG